MQTNMIATEVSNLDENTDLNIEVTDTNLGIDQILSGKIIIDGENEYPLHYNEKGKLVGTVPFSDFGRQRKFFFIKLQYLMEQTQPKLRNGR